MQEHQPVSESGVTTDPTYINLDDINEAQFPPPPTQKDVLAETIFDENNDIRGDSDSSNPTDRNFLSGAGHLGTNEIMTFPNALSEAGQLSISNSNNNYEKENDANEELVPAGNTRYNYPELDEAVENAVNNLPTSDESPLIPLIKVLNERKHEKSEVENMSPKDQAWENFYQNKLILKLANKVQKQNEENYIQTENQNTLESVAQEQDKSSQLENQNGANEEQPCDCEDGCDETLQDQTESENPGCDEETTLDQMKAEKEDFGEELPNDQPVPEKSECGEETEQDHTEVGKTLEPGSQSGIDDKQINKKFHLKTVAKVIIMLRRPKVEQKELIQNPALSPISSFGNERLFKSREDAPLENNFLRVITTSNSMTIIPSSSLKVNEDSSRLEQEITSMSAGEGGDNNNEDESDQNNDRSSLPRDESDENEINSSEYRSRASFTRYPSDDQSLSFQNKEVVQQTLPKDILLKLLINIMKQKAAANALKEIRGKQTLPFPSFEESSNTPPISGLVIIRPIHTLAPPQLPPLHFPDENSGYKIKHLEDYRGFPLYKQLKEANQNTERGPTIGVKTLNKSQEGANSDGFGRQNSTPEEIPWFIRNILANLSGPRIQSIPVPLAPIQKPAEKKNAVLFRALLAPYSL